MLVNTSGITTAVAVPVHFEMDMSLSKGEQFMTRLIAEVEKTHSMAVLELTHLPVVRTLILSP